MQSRITNQMDLAPRLRLRTGLTMLMIFLVLVTGGVLSAIEFFMEARQAEEQGNQTLDLIAEDVNDQTETFLETFRNRAQTLGKMLDCSLLDFSDNARLSQVSIEMMKLKGHIVGVEFIHHSTGAMLHMGRDRQNNLFTLQISKKNMGDGFQGVTFKDNDPLLTHPTAWDGNPMDPRNYEYYKAFKDRSEGGWTEVRQHNNSVFSSFQPVFSYIYPVHNQAGEFLGIVGIDLGMIELSRYLKSKNSKIGYGGAAFALERKPNGRIVVVGHESLCHPEGPLSGQENVQDLVEAKDHPDPRIRAFARSLATVSPADVDPFDSPTTLRNRFRAGDGFLWNFSWISILPGMKPNWIIVTTARNDLLVAEAWNRIWIHGLVLIPILVAGGLLCFIFAAKVAKPMEAISRDIVHIGRGDIRPAPPGVFYALELANLANGIEEMKLGLLSFGKYIPKEVVRQVLLSHKTAELFAEKKSLTIFFSDLQDFTAIAEQLNPETLVRLVGDHLDLCTQIIQKQLGTVDKFIGDSVMAFWNAPNPVGGHAIRACLAALECTEAMKELNQRSIANGLPPLFMRIGINTGSTLVGNFGSDTRLNYTTIGDPVNLASRLEGINKIYGTWILISEFTRNDLDGRILTRPVDRVAVKGKAQAVRVYEVMARAEDSTPALQNIIELTTRGLQCFEERKFHEAKGCFEQLLASDTGDALASFQLHRCEELIANPPPDDWDGITHRYSK